MEGDKDRRGKAALGNDGLEGVAREPVGVVLLGDVHGRHRAQVFVSQVIQGLARLVVGQMPARRCDALLDDVGIGAHLKHARIVDIETLQQTNKQLIETLDELNKIRADGKAKRANAEQELGRIEGELRQKMLEINS